MSSSLSESISLQQLTVGELNNINVKSFNANKAPGHDNISMKIIHQSFQNIVQPLVTIINTLLSTGVFPESLKIAKVIPVFKADDPTLFSNYRPISILPAFSKLFEKVMYNRLINFLNLHNVCDPPRDIREKGDDRLTTCLVCPKTHFMCIFNY